MCRIITQIPGIDGSVFSC